MQKKMQLTADTPLSALFRESHHRELRTVIESWRNSLLGDFPGVACLDLNIFLFDHRRIQSKRVYLDLIQLMEKGALRCSVRTLAQYLYDHTNLSRSPKTLYEMLGRYRRESGEYD